MTTSAIPRSAVTQGEARCDRTDLLPSQCAHCRHLTLDPALRDLAEVQITRWVRAATDGTCPSCGHETVPGDRIAVSATGRFCERCTS